MVGQVSAAPEGSAGGDRGCFARVTMPKAFDDTCFSLAIGKTSGVVVSPYGYHVFKVLGRRPAKARGFKEVQAEAERRAPNPKPPRTTNPPPRNHLPNLVHEISPPLLNRFR